MILQDAMVGADLGTVAAGYQRWALADLLKRRGPALETGPLLRGWGYRAGLWNRLPLTPAATADPATPASDPASDSPDQESDPALPSRPGR